MSRKTRCRPGSTLISWRVFLRQLLENAARFTPPGGRIFLRSWRSSTALEFVVEDTGPGIDPHDLPFVFEKFYRGRSGANKSKGSGMGLAISRAILIAHGGGIKASSAPRKGARFHFWIPLIGKEPAGIPFGSVNPSPALRETERGAEGDLGFDRDARGSIP